MIIKNITTPEELVSKLDQVEDSLEYFEVLRAMNIPIEELETYFTWNESHSTRNCISSTKDYELVIVCFEKGQKTKIQDYNNAKAWIHPIFGALREDRYLLSKNGTGLLKISSVTLEPHDFSYAENTGIHQFINVYESRSVALVLYTKPIKERKIYDCSEEGTCKTWVEPMEYDNVCVIDRD